MAVTKRDLGGVGHDPVLNSFESCEELHQLHHKAVKGGKRSSSYYITSYNARSLTSIKSRLKVVISTLETVDTHNCYTVSPE